MAKRASDAAVPDDKHRATSFTGLMQQLASMIDKPLHAEESQRAVQAELLSELVDRVDETTADAVQREMRKEALELLARYDAMESAQLEREKREIEEHRNKAAEKARAAAESAKQREELEEKRVREELLQKAGIRTAALVAELDKHKTREEAKLAIARISDLLVAVEEVWEDLENAAEDSDAPNEVVSAFHAAKCACDRVDELELA